MWNPLAYDRDFAKLLQFLRSKIWFHWNNIILPSKLLGKFCLLMPCPFTGPKMFCAGPNFLSQPKNLTSFSVSLKTFVPAQKTILLNANHLFVWHKMFVTATIWR